MSWLWTQAAFSVAVTLFKASTEKTSYSEMQPLFLLRTLITKEVPSMIFFPEFPTIYATLITSQSHIQKGQFYSYDNPDFPDYQDYISYQSTRQTSEPARLPQEKRAISQVPWLLQAWSLCGFTEEGMIGTFLLS